MIPQTLIQDAIRDGLTLAATETGTLRVQGSKSVVAKWAPILKERKTEILAALRSPANDAHPVSWEQWQIAHPSPGTVPLTEDEALSLRAWLDLIGEHDKATIADVLTACEKFPDSRAHFLNEAATTGARQEIASRAALEAAEERAAIMEHDGGMERSEVERVSKLAEAFYNHLFAHAEVTGCCWAPRNRYCKEGLRLRDAYYEAAKAAKALT